MVFLLFYYEVTFWCSFRVESLAIQCIRCMQPIFLLVFITHWENTQLKILQDVFHGISSMAPSRYSSLTFFKPRGIQCFQWQNCPSRNKLPKFLLWAVCCTPWNNCLQRMLRLQKQAVIKVRNTKIKVVCANSGCANAQPEPISLRDSLFFPPHSFEWQHTWYLPDGKLLDFSFYSSCVVSHLHGLTCYLLPRVQVDWKQSSQSAWRLLS